MLKRMVNALQPYGVANFLETQVGPYVKKRAVDRFREEGDDVSGPWAPLKESTREIRYSSTEYQTGAAHPINVRTGRLEKYVTGSQPLAYANSFGASLRYPARASSKKEIRDKMRTAQFGLQSPPTVARPVLGLNEHDLLFVITAFNFHLSSYDTPHPGSL